MNHPKGTIIVGICGYHDAYGVEWINIDGEEGYICTKGNINYTEGNEYYWRAVPSQCIFAVNPKPIIFRKLYEKLCLK